MPRADMTKTEATICRTEVTSVQRNPLDPENQQGPTHSVCKMPMISVITVAFNASETIAETLKSVDCQTYSTIEHIVVDGASTDLTLDIVHQHKNPQRRVISEKDDGLYDAMNKGVSRASGDVIGFLNADDVYADVNVLTDVAQAFQDPRIDALYGDLKYFKGKHPQKAGRRYSSKHFSPARLAGGFMPAHPTLYMRRSTFLSVGPFRTDFKIAADFEHCVRLFSRPNLRYRYLPKTMVRMRVGGASTTGIKSKSRIAVELRRALRDNQINFSYSLALKRYFTKILLL